MDWTKFIQKPEDKEGISWTDFIRPDDEDRDYAAELRRIRGIAEPPEEAPDISFTDIMRGALAFPQRAGHEAARVIMGMGGPEAADEWFGAEHRQPPTTGWEAADITADILGELTGHVTGLKMIGGVTRPAVSLLGRGITTAAPTLTRTLQPFTAPLAPGVPFATTMAARTGVEHLAGEEKEAVDYLASAAWGFGAGVTSPLASKLIRDMPTQFKGNPYAAAETVLSGAAAGLGGEVAQSIATGEVSSPGDIGMSMAMMALFNLSSIITNPAQKAAVIGARDKVLRDRAAYDEWLRIIGASRKDSQQDIFRKEREFWKAQEQRYDAEKAEQARKLEAHMKEMIKKYIDLPPDATDRQIKNALYKTFHPDIARDKPSFTDFGRAIKVAKQVIRATPMPEGAKKTAEQMVTKSQKTLFPSLTHGARPVISVGDDGKVRVTGFGGDVRSPRDIDLAKVPTVYEETPAITGDRPTTAEERQLQKDMVRDAGIKYIADQLRTAERATFTTDVSLEPDMHGKVRRIGEFEFSRSDEGKPFKVISYDYETGEPVPRIRHKFDRLEQVAEFIHYLTPHPSYKEVKELETAPREVEPFTVPKDKVLNQLEGIIENWKATGIEKISPDDPRKGAAEERQVYDQLKSLVRKLKDPRVAAEYIGPKEEYLKLRGDLERFTIGTAEKFVENLVARQKTPEEVAADQIREEREAIAEPEPTPAPEPTPEPVAEPVLTVETKDDTFELKVGDWVQLPDRAAPVKVVDDTDTATLSLETEHGAVMKRGRGALEGAQKIEEPPAEPAAPEPVEDPPATKEAPGPEDAPAPGPLEQRVHQEITEKDTELADYMVQRAMDWLGKEPLSKLQEAGPDDDIIGEVNAPLLINKIGIAATGTTQLNKAREAGVMRLMLEKGDITQEEWDDYLSGLGLKEPEKEKFIQRRVDAEAFERTMKHFGYESLYDKERAEQKRPMVAKSDFKLWEERYLEEVKKDEPFLKRLTDEWEGQVAETERARIIDESFGKEDWEVPQWVIVERSGGARNVVIERHQAEVKKALEEGKPVPQEVLEEYPDLVPEAPEPEVAPTKEPPAPIKLGKEETKFYDDWIAPSVEAYFVTNRPEIAFPVKRSYDSKGPAIIKDREAIETALDQINRMQEDRRWVGKDLAVLTRLDKKFRALLEEIPAREPEPTPAPEPTVTEEPVETETVQVRRPGDRTRANLNDLLADYKARGMDVHRAYDQLVIDRGLKPDIGKKELIATWDHITPKLFETIEEIEYSPTHLIQTTPESPEREVMVTEETDDFVRYVDEAGRTGSDPKTVIHSLRPLDEPAPEPAPPKPDIELDVKGKTSKAKAENIEIGTQFALVEADKLISSHDIMLREDPRFPEELQPRERTERMATEAQMYEIIQKLDPERLGENIIAAHGSPIIGKDGIVETGNIRTISLKRLYNDEHPNATRYRQWLSENAEQFGLSKDQLDKMEKPILVRVRTSELSSEERVNFVRTANKEETAAMSATEQAMVDADRVDANLIRLFVPYEDGRIDHPANRDFITAFLNKVVGVAKKGEYIDKTGRISQAGIKRIQNAIFARAYRDPATLERLAEDPSSEIKNITTAMLNVAPRVIQLQEKIKKGLAYDLDLSPEMKEAAKKVLHMKAENLTLDEFLKKKSLFDEGRTDPLVADILIMMDNFKRSAKKMTKVFNNYLGAMEKAPDPRQQTFIGLDKKFERQRPDRREVLRGAVYDVEGRKYDDPSLFDEKRAEAVRSEEHPKTDRDPTAGETTSPRFLRRRPTEEEAFKPEDRHKIIEEPIDPDAEPASARDIRKYITDEIGIYVGKKRLFTPGAEGEYRPFERVMRVKDTTDLHTIAHEFGHDVRKYLNLNLEKHRAELIQAFARSDLDETKYKPEELPYEGAAEVVKAYLLKGRTGAIEMAPSFTFHIEDQMTKDKEFEEKFEGLVDLYQRFRTQNAKEYLRGFLVSGFKKKEPQLTTKAERLYSYWWDDLMFLYKIPSEVLGLDPRKLEMPMVENPYHLALSTRVLGAPLETMFSKWAYDPYYRDAGPPLKKILEPVKDYLSDGEKVGDFSLYIFAKAAQERQELGIRVGPDQAALNKVVAEIEAEHPDWIEVNKQLQDFKKLLLDWAVWGDLIAPGAKKRMTDKYEWHMPLYVFLGEEQPITQLTAGNRFVNLPESFKRAIGTNAERLDPIESIVKDFVYIMNNVYRNKSALKFLDTLYKSPELGKMGHKLPKPTVVDEVSLKALKGDLKKAGLTDEELEELDLDTMVKTYSKVHYARMKEHRENIVTVRRKGEVEFWQVHPEIYDTLMSIGSRPETSQIIDKLVAPFTKLFAKGSLLSPTFSLVRNPVRDAVIGFTHGGDLGVKPFVDLARGITLIAKKDHKVDLFNAAKGARSGISRIISQADEFTVDKLMKEPGIGEKVNPVKFLETLLSSVEHGSRIGYFAKRIDQVDKDSLTKEEWQEHVLRAAAEARGFINQDYAIKGKWASKADKVSPFFTSTVGGPRTTYEAIRRDPWGHAWRTFVSLTLPSMILYLFNRNDPRYQELEQWKKDYFWTFLTPNGMFHLVKPFLPGLLFASGPERVMQAIDEQDPSVLTEWAKNVVKFGGPGWVIPLLMPTMEYLANHSFFTGRSIVPRSEEYLMPADQYGPGSSLAARVIGARTNLSPRKLDQFTRSLGSTLSTNILDTIDLIAGEMPLSEYAASLAGSRQTDYAGARSVDEFYDELRELETIENTIQLRHVRGQPIGDLQLDRQRLDLLRRYNDRMTTIRGRIRDIQNDPNLDDTIKERHLEELRLMMVNLAREAMGRELIQP